MGVGKIVLVKSFPSEPLSRCVFGELDDGVLLCLQEDLTIWEYKGIRPLTVKCPKSRVYEFDPDLYEKLKEAAYVLKDNELLETLWKQASPYEGKKDLSSKVASNVT